MQLRGTDDRAIEVQRQPPGRSCYGAFGDDPTQEAAEVVDGEVVELRQPTRECRDVRHPVQANDALHQGVGAVVVEVTKTSPPEEQVHDHQQHDPARAVSAARMQMPNGVAHSRPGSGLLQQGLEHHESAERCEVLLLETNLGDGVGCGRDVVAGYSHVGSACCFVSFDANEYATGSSPFAHSKPNLDVTAGESPDPGKNPCLPAELTRHSRIRAIQTPDLCNCGVDS